MFCVVLEQGFALCGVITISYKLNKYLYRRIPSTRFCYSTVLIKSTNWIIDNDGLGLVRRRLLPVLSLGGNVGSAFIPPLHLYRFD